MPLARRRASGIYGGLNGRNRCLGRGAGLGRCGQRPRGGRRRADGYEANESHPSRLARKLAAAELSPSGKPRAGAANGKCAIMRGAATTGATVKFEAVLFDCDGVLVDSERITNGVLRDMLEELGWKLSTDECMRLFLGKAVKDERALIESKTGQPLTDEWLVRFRERRNVGLMHGVQPIRGAVGAVAVV